MSLRREVNALAEILENPANEDKSTEDLADELITALDAVRAQHNRLAVLCNYSWDQENWHLAVLGPFSTRSRSAAAAQGEGIVGRAMQPGQGRFLLVPAYANTRDAWAAIKPDEGERRAALSLARSRTESGWNPWDPKGPVCRCGVRVTDRRDTGICPVHPERKQ